MAVNLRIAGDGKAGYREFCIHEPHPVDVFGGTTDGIHNPHPRFKRAKIAGDDDIPIAAGVVSIGYIIRGICKSNPH